MTITEISSRRLKVVVSSEAIPRWADEIMITLDYYLQTRSLDDFVSNYESSLRKVHKIRTDGWRRVLIKTLLMALLIALPHDYNRVVQPVINLLVRAFIGDNVRLEEWEAAIEAANKAEWFGEKAWCALYASQAAVAAAATEVRSSLDKLRPMSVARRASGALKMAADTRLGNAQQISEAWDKIANIWLMAIEQEVDA